MKGVEPTFLEWWDLGSGAKKYSVELPGSALTYGALALSHDQSIIALGTSQRHEVRNSPRKQTIEFRDAKNGELLDEFDATGSPEASHATFSHDEHCLVLCSSGPSESWCGFIPSGASEWLIAEGVRARFVEKDKWTFGFAQPPHFVIYPAGNARNANDPASRTVNALTDVDKLPWQEDPNLAENQAKAVAVKTAKLSFSGDQKEFVNSLGMRLVAFPKGDMESGSPVQDTGGIETPRFLVRINRPLMIDSDLLTVGRFRQFVEQSGYKTVAETSGAGSYVLDGNEWKIVAKANWRDPGFDQTDDHPVVCVENRDAVAFCDWLSKAEERHYRLPTEGEWEYACRAATRTPYYFAASERELTDYAWIAENSENHTHPVGEKKPNPWGLFDILGNAQVCCADGLPGVPGTTTIRGASWASKARDCRVTSRMTGGPPTANSRTGFRVLLDSR
jgi:formylglycine-generating enzyme required for sulfatase activity